MANATKKSMILTVAAVLIAVLLFAASMAIGTETQPNAFADFWDDYATEESGITGLGTVESPFVIASAEDLARMSVWVNSGVHADSHYLLSQNIDLSGHDFTPIGNIGYPFAGSFDGDGYTVSGLTINALGSPAGAHFIGLFGVTDATASIRSFGILSGNITFDTNEDISSLYVGSVAAVNNGTIEDVYSYADLQISLEYIYSQGAFVGGLTAQNNDGATVTGSLFAGQLDVAQPVDALGGICGENNGVIENVYNAGKIVSGDTVGLTYIGGINGINRNTLKYAINSAPIYGVTKGGITALRVGNTVQFSYYDSDLSLVSKAIYGINDTNQFMGLTSQELSDSTIEALDFPTAKWGKYSDEFDGARYFAPYLTTIEELNPVYSKDAATLRVYEFDRTKRFDTENLYGTEANPYILSTATHFDTLAELVNSSYSYENKYFVAQGDQDGILDLTGFNKTVGTRGLTGGDRPFEGSFDGKYVTVTNFVIDRSSATSETLKRYIGLFGFVSSEGHVFNFKLDNTCSVVAKEYSGGVVGYNMGRVENIESQAAVRGDSFIGGVIGYNGNSGILNDILCVGEVLGNVGASHIYGVVGDGYFQNSSNVWYAVSSSSASINTQNRGRTLIIDIENAVRNKDPLTGEISFGQTDDYGAHSIKVTKDSNGRIAFNGQASTPWAIEYRFADETIVSASADYEPPAVAGGEIRPVYARLVRTITAQVSGYESRLYFNKTLEGSTTTYQINDKFYRGQEVTMYSEVPEGSYLPRASALVQDPFTYSVIEDPTFVFSYSTLQNDPRVVVHFNMIASLYMVAPQFDAINAPAVLPKTYDGTGNLFMGGGEPYSVSVDGFSVDYSYNVAGGAPRNVGHYAITINVRSLDGIRRGSQTVEYYISPKSITLSTDMLTRQKEYDGEVGPVPAPVINQSGITDIITGDAVEIKSDASYATTDIGWTTADFTFTINGAASNNYIAPPSMINVPCEITKRALIIEIDTQHLSYVYDGLAAQIPYFGYQKAPLAWLVPVADIYMSKDIVHTEMDAIDVDTYDVNVRLNDDPQFNYEGKPITYYYTVEFADTYTFTITPRPVDITFADYEGLVYNGVAQSIKAYFDDIEGVRQEVPSACIAYEMLEGSGNFDEPDKLKHAGSYSVTVTLPLEGNYVATLSTNTFAVTLAKAYQPAITIAPLNGPFVYGDAPRTLALDGAAADATGEVTYTLLTGKAEINGDTIEFTGGGDVFVSAYKEEDFNYYSATTPNYKITVNKAEILIDLADIVKIYGDTTDQLVYVFDGYAARDNGKSVPDGFVPPSVIITGESVDEPLNQYKKYNAGIYTLHIQQDAESDGYTFDYSLFEPMPSLTIQQKAVILRPDNKEQTYGRADALGAPQDLPLTYTLYSGDETLIVALSDITLTREDGVSVRTGDQYYTIECDNEEAATVANPNYNITFETGKYYILPKTLTLTAISQSKNFGDADPIPLYSVSGLAPWDTAEQVVGVKNESLPVLTRQEGENAFYEFSNQYGVYYYSSSNVQLSPDYTLTFIHGTLTIYKATPVMQSQSEMNVPYGDNIDTLQPSAVFTVTVNGESRTVNGSIEWLDGSARPSFDGENLFSARFTPAVNYDISKLENNVASIDVQLDVGIFKRPIDLDIETTEFLYTGKEQALRITFGNVLEGDQIHETVTYSDTMLNAGEYTVTIAIENGNYTLIAPDETETDELVLDITVQKAPLLIYLEDIELGQGIRPPKDFIYEGFVNGETEDDLITKPDVTFYTEAGNFEITPFGAVSDNYEISYQSSRQSVTKTLLTSEVQNFTIAGNFDFQTEMTVAELSKSANRALFGSYNSHFAPIKNINKLGNVQISRLYDVGITVGGEEAALQGVSRATIEIPTRLRESKRFYVVLIDEDGSMKLAQNVVRSGNNLSFDFENCSMVGIVNPPDYTFIILGCVVVLLVISVFALDMVSERLGIGRHKKKKKANKTEPAKK